MTGPSPSTRRAARPRGGPPRRRPARTGLAGVGLGIALAFPHAASAQDGPPGGGESVGPLRPYAPGTPAFGTGGSPSRPATAVLRQDEDWSWLAGRERTGTDRLRYLPIGDDGQRFLTFLADADVRRERYHDQIFGLNADGDGSTHWRLRLHAGLTWSERLRVFGALKYGDVDNRRFDTPVGDDDGPDVHMGFVEVGFGDLVGLDRVSDAFVRVGRQELHYGSGRIITIREGPNVRADFDGILVRARRGRVVADAFAARQSDEEQGTFDNGFADDDGVWGVYGTIAPADGAATTIDAYYVGFSRDASPYAFQEPPVSERRHTVGARWYTAGPAGDGFGYEIEAGVQFGSADGIVAGEAQGDGPPPTRDADIRAGFLALEASYGFAERPWAPTLRARTGISSGDSDPTDDRLGTFRAPAPAGKPFDNTDLLGPGNITGLGLFVDLAPLKALTVTLGTEWFARVDDEDGLYAPPQVPVLGVEGDERGLGNETTLALAWRPLPNLSLGALASRFSAFDYAEDNSPGEDVDYAELVVSYEF